MANHSELLKLFELDEVELACRVVLSDNAFKRVRNELHDHYQVDLRSRNSFIRLTPYKLSSLRKDLFRKIENVVRNFNHQLYNEICVKLKWCRNRDRPAIENAEYLASVLDVIFTNGAAALSVLLVKRKFLDKLCNCAKGSP